MLLLITKRMDLPPNLLAYYTRNVHKPSPRTPREEQLDRAAKITGWTIPRLLGKTNHFPPEPLYTDWLTYLNDTAEKQGRNPAALWQHLPQGFPHGRSEALAP